MSNTEPKMENQIHVFEKAGLGKAPFKFIGTKDQDLRYGEAILNREEYEKTGIALTTQPGGTCEYCGRAIKNMYRVRSADNKEFVVGCECIHKTGDAGLIKRVKEAEKQRRNAKKQAKRESIRAELKALLESETGKDRPHPNAYLAKDGKTLFDYAEFCLLCGGELSAARALRMLKS